MKQVGIYRYTNLINGKRYIGQSVNIISRYNKHLSMAKGNSKNKSMLEKAIQKYGICNFRFEVLEYCDTEQLNELEMYWINYYNTNVFKGGYGYNGNDGGNGHGGVSPNKGKHLTDVAKEKLRQYHLGKKLSDEHRLNVIKTLSNHATYGMLGKHQSDYQKECARTSMKNKVWTEEYKQKLRKPKSDTTNMYKQTGNHWFHLNEINVFIKPSQIPYYESIGYIKGRYIPKKNKQ